jgi:hypothetical protein
MFKSDERKDNFAPSKFEQAVTLLTRNREVSRLNLGRNTDYPAIFRGYP